MDTYNDEGEKRTRHLWKWSSQINISPAEANKRLPCLSLQHLQVDLKQVMDFIDRLHKQVLPIISTGFKTYALNDYLQSGLGKASQQTIKNTT